MKKTVFLLLLLPIGFGLECSNIDTKEIGSSVIDYSVSGLIDLNFNIFTFENFSFTFRGVPQILLDDYVTNGNLSTDSYNNTVLFFHKPIITENLEWHFNTTLSDTRGNEMIVSNVRFPYDGEYPSEVMKYLEYTKTANKDLRIIILTNNLLAGVNDYLSAVAKISEFTAYYISYDLGYFSASSATATEIYDAKRGVCDEFSTLTISMFRSVGIPARYVSGYVYTNIGNNGCTNFEPHSWVEVYLPNHGWVSVDPTYKEFFWINSAHIPLYKNQDMLDISSLYIERHGSESSAFLDKNTYSFDINLLSYNKSASALNMSINANSIVSEDSYLIINVSIANPTDYWIMDTLISTPIKTIDLINSNPSIPLVIPPMQTISKFFIFKIPDLGCPSACYSDATFKFTFGGGESSSKIIRIDSEHNVKYGLEGLLGLAREETGIISPNLLVSSIAFNREKYLEQKPVLSFRIKNIGNSMMDVNMSINYGDINVSETFDSLFINEERSYERELELPIAAKGLVNATLTFNFLNTTLTHNTSFIVLKEPEYEVLVSNSGGFGYSVILNTEGTIDKGTITAYINDKEAESRSIEKNNAMIFSEEDFNEGDNSVKFVLDYSQGNDYYFKIILLNHVYSQSIFEKISRFFYSLINIFKILLSA